MKCLLARDKSCTKINSGKECPDIHIYICVCVYIYIYIHIHRKKKKILGGMMSLESFCLEEAVFMLLFEYATG